jgi:hypothetical protein
MVDLVHSQEMPPGTNSDGNLHLKLSLHNLEATIQTASGNDLNKGELRKPEDSSSQIPEKNLEIADRKKIWGPYAGHLFHRAVLNVFRQLTQSSSSNQNILEAIRSVVDRQPYSRLPATEGLQLEQQNNLIQNLKDTHSQLIEQLIAALWNDHVVVLSEWKHKPDSKRTKELASLWDKGDIQEIAADELGISSSSIPELTYYLIKDGNELAKHPEDAPTHLGLESFFKSHFIGYEIARTAQEANGTTTFFPVRKDSPIMKLPLSHLMKQMDSRKWWNEAYELMQANLTKQEIATLRYLRLCVGAHQEIGQYIGGAYTLHNFTHNPETNKPYTPKEIATNIRDALHLFSPYETDFDAESIANSLISAPDSQKRQELLAAPHIIPDLIYIDFGNEEQTTETQQLIKEMRELVQSEEGWANGKPDFVAHPNFFYNPKMLDLLDRSVRLGGKIHLADIKTSLALPGDPKKHSEKIGFYIATFTQWLIAGRRRQGKSYSLVDAMTDPIVQNLVVPKIIFAASNLNQEYPWARPLEEPFLSPEPIWELTWEQLRTLSDISPKATAAEKRVLIREIFEPFTLILRKYILRQIIRETNNDNQIDPD